MINGITGIGVKQNGPAAKPFIHLEICEAITLI
jgi:hypothetical protein